MLTVVPHPEFGRHGKTRTLWNVCARLKALEWRGKGDQIAIRDLNAVLRILTEEGVTRNWFVELDLKPGFYDPDYLSWFWKLRRVRNNHSRELWAELEANEAAQ